ncbi:MAG: ABC transporter permease [Clostridia bacterium]|nr:ABC transporter permease [Clostridia bacterium]
MLDTITAGVSQGFIWAVLALGVYVSFRLLDFADLSCEGSITLGASIAAMLIWRGMNPFLASVLAFCGGLLAGSVTGLLSTKLKIPPILAGILTMISLYSINIHIMSYATKASGTANLSLLNFSKKTIYGTLRTLTGHDKTSVTLIFGMIFAAVVIFALYWFFGTELGSTIRATGSNEKMCRAQGINTDTAKILGLALSNGLIALSGALLCQYQNYSDVNMGVGSIVIGLASIIIGETIFMKVKNFALKLLGIVVGSVIYRVVVAIVIYSGMPSTDLKLMTAAIVMVALSLPIIKNALLSRKAVHLAEDDYFVDEEKKDAEVKENV